MTRLRIVGRDRDFRKISHTKALRAAFGLGLRDGKRVADDVLDGIVREFEIDDARTVEVARALRRTGARVEIAPAP